MKNIFDKVELHHLTTKKRLVRSATWEGIASPDGSITDVAYEIYEELSNGGMNADGMDFIGTYDNFTYGDPAVFLRNINEHMPTAREKKLIFLERTGHTYQQKEQELADKLCELIQDWRSEAERK